MRVWPYRVCAEPPSFGSGANAAPTGTIFGDEDRSEGDVVTHGLGIVIAVLFWIWVAYRLFRWVQMPKRERELRRERRWVLATRHAVRPNQVNHTNSGGHGYYKWTTREQREWKRLGARLEELDAQIRSVRR
jgi:hypothetical protein